MAGKPHESNLVGEIRAIKAEMARLQGLLDEARAELHREGTPELAALKRGGGNKARRQGHSYHRDAKVSGVLAELVEGSAAEWAAQAIRTTGRPMHVRDLIPAIENQGHKVKKTTLVGTLHRWVKKKAVFYRAGKNTFGLIELKKG